MELTANLFKTMKQKDKNIFFFEQIQINTEKINKFEKIIEEVRSIRDTPEFKRFVIEFPQFMERFNLMDGTFFELMDGMNEAGILPKNMMKIKTEDEDIDEGDIEED